MSAQDEFAIRGEQAVTLLSQAADHQCDVLLVSEAASDIGPLTGRLIASDEHAAWIVVTPARDIDLNQLNSAYCTCQLVVDQSPYCFDSHVVSVEKREMNWQIELAAPEAISRLDRRVRPRVRLARSCDIHLIWGPSIEPQRAVGRLLNLSTVGIACLIDRGTSGSILIGDPVETHIPVQADDWLELPAVVRNKTAGNDDASWVIGMEFVAGEMSDAQLARLQAHVSNPTLSVVR